VRPPLNGSIVGRTATGLSKALSLDWSDPVGEEKTRVYQALVWVEGQDRGERLSLFATSLDDAKRQLKERYGQEIKSSIWNEDDARKPRQ
jgi:hypothetical protein